MPNSRHIYGDVLAVERQELESSRGRVWVRSGDVYFLSSREAALARNKEAARAEAAASSKASEGGAPKAPPEGSTR